MSGRFRIETLGCKANTYDSALLRQELRRRGWRRAAKGEAADLVVVNSCTVTDRADRASRKSAARLARRHPDAIVVMTGCAAETDPEGMAAVDGVRFVVGNQDKDRLVAEVLAAAAGGADGAPADDAPADGAPAGEVLGGVRPYARMRSRHPRARRWPAPAAAFAAPRALGGRTRAFVKIQEGCDAFCTFCVIPYARGPSRSLAADAVIEQVRAVCADGVREVVLTGTALGDFGVDRPGELDLEGLIRRILADTALEGLRVGSLDPHELTPGLRDLMVDEPRLRPHAHVSLQSPHPTILKRMRRRYGVAAVEEALTGLAALTPRLAARHGVIGGPFVGMDVIVGFPGETEAIFEASVAALAALPWTRLHVFPYSERAGTPATRLDGAVPPAERKRRVGVLMALSNARVLAAAEAIAAAAEPVTVLVEGPAKGLPDGWVQGRTANYHLVAFEAPGGRALKNTSARVRPVCAEALPRLGSARLRGRLVGGLAEGRLAGAG
ncbi:MAG: hypothetical protein CSA66_03105 [Proteobacteria bacterium]|nr:MAG: hypothetical protein CSA66_03105 [Pseudomonadota bacterium]